MCHPRKTARRSFSESAVECILCPPSSTERRACRRGRQTSPVHTMSIMATHGLRSVVGFPQRAMRRVNRTRRMHGLTPSAEITRIPAADCSFDRKGVTLKDPVPFDRTKTTTGIMHVGVGGFHRSHQLVRCKAVSKHKTRPSPSASH